MSKCTNSNRREFLQSTSAFAGVAALGWLADARAEVSLTDLTAVQAVAAMRNGEIKAETYATALLDRQNVLTALHAFIALARHKVLEAARNADIRRGSGVTLGALHGLPVAAKDSINTRDLPTTSGTKALRNFQPKDD